MNVNSRIDVNAIVHMKQEAQRSEVKSIEMLSGSTKNSPLETISNLLNFVCNLRTELDDEDMCKFGFVPRDRVHSKG